MMKNRDYAILMLVVLLVLLAAFFLAFRIKSLQATLSEIENEKAAIEKLYEKALYFQDIKSREAELLSTVEMYKRMVPGEPDKNGITITMYQLAENNGINLNKIQFGQEIKGQRLIKVPVTINLDGNYVDIINFLKGIRQLERIYRLININLSRAEQSSDRIYADILLNAYYKR
ncbi:MAG: type 4a pilus biogenesis protein PilO [Firmicutes bacterium]|nr:type 4a pilus biogenesis protein PilO [Bacillota bacterium]